MASTKPKPNLFEHLPSLHEDDAPHLNELSGALTRAFGGVEKLAETLKNLMDDAKKPDWLRTRAASLVISTMTAANKLEADKSSAVDALRPSDADLKWAARELIHKSLGIDDVMFDELKDVVDAWPKLPAETRQGIVATVKSKDS